MELLKKLFETSSVAGYETEMKKLIKNEIKDCCDSIYEDNFGNLIAISGKGDNPIVINTPISEDGLFVTSYKENVCKCSPIGKFKPDDISGGKFKTSGGNIAVAIYNNKEKKDDFSELSLDFFDTEEIKAGEILYPVSDFVINGNCITGKSAGIKAGIYALINIIKSRKSKDNSLIFVFSVEDNLGFKGAKVAFSSLNPDCGYVISHTDASNKATELLLGKGPVLRLADKNVVFNNTIINKMTDKLLVSQIQKEITQDASLTNNRAMYLNNGISLINLNIPVKFKGKFYETFNKKDVDNLIDMFKNL